ncbi:hypothetical protein Nmel_014681 [Mimus melanotis]
MLCSGRQSCSTKYSLRNDGCPVSTVLCNLISSYKHLLLRALGLFLHRCLQDCSVQHN